MPVEAAQADLVLSERELALVEAHQDLGLQVKWESSVLDSTAVHVLREAISALGEEGGWLQRGCRDEDPREQCFGESETAWSELDAAQWVDLPQWEASGGHPACEPPFPKPPFAHEMASLGALPNSPLPYRHPHHDNRNNNHE